MQGQYFFKVEWNLFQFSFPSRLVAYTWIKEPILFYYFYIAKERRDEFILKGISTKWNPNSLVLEWNSSHCINLITVAFDSLKSFLENFILTYKYQSKS